jgi:hypothetical protein
LIWTSTREHPAVGVEQERFEEGVAQSGWRSIVSERSTNAPLPAGHARVQLAGKV